MTPFKTIQQEAELRQGGAAAVAALLPVPKTAQALRTLPNSEYLSLMSRRIFRAGLKHSMVDAKWPIFTEVFFDFDIDCVRMMSDEDLETLLKDKRIIRHWGKIKSVRANAAAIYDLLDEYQGVGTFLADWPGTRIVELWDDLKQRFTQLGGNSGPYFLRMAGKDTFIFTKHVVRALNHWDAFAGEPKSKQARSTVQGVFNQWVEESGLPLCQISQTLALTTD